MRLWQRMAPIAVPLLIIFAVTDVLYHFKDALHSRHLVFFYLLPTAFVAMLYGSVLSMICAIDATLVAAFFLYDPTYTLYVADPREVGELIFFAGTALIGAKCMAELMRPPAKPRDGLEPLTIRSAARASGKSKLD
jgi:K+-sensing histidine kinase KdpD